VTMFVLGLFILFCDIIVVIFINNGQNDAVDECGACKIQRF